MKNPLYERLYRLQYLMSVWLVVMPSERVCPSVCCHCRPPVTFRRLTDMLVEVGERNQHFVSVHSRQLHQVFQMTLENCRRQLDKVIRADRVIHQQQLGLPFSPPDLSHLQPPEVRL